MNFLIHLSYLCLSCLLYLLCSDSVCLSYVFLLICLWLSSNSAGLRQHWNSAWPHSLPEELENESMFLFESVRRKISFFLADKYSTAGHQHKVCFGYLGPAWVAALRKPARPALYSSNQSGLTWNSCWIFQQAMETLIKKTHSICSYFSLFLAPRSNFLPPFLFFFVFWWCCLAQSLKRSRNQLHFVMQFSQAAVFIQPS